MMETELIDDAHYAPPPEVPFDTATLGLPAERFLKPGIYFDLDENTYHASFGLSYSGIKHLRVSPYDWWVRSPLNPQQAEVQAEESNSEARELGKAFDARIICGREFFQAHYAPAFDPGEYPDALEGAAAIQDRLRELKADGATVKLTGNKAELIERLLELDPSAKIMDELRVDYFGDNRDKGFLAAHIIAKIEMAAALIEGHPDLGKALRGGQPQVSVVWECKDTGVLCRSRFDYLKSKAIVDLKTLQARDGAPLEASIGKEIGWRKYHVQAAFYLEAASHIPGFIKAGNVYGDVPADFLQSLVKHPDKQWLWIFQLKGVAPIAKGRTLPSESTLLQLGQAECDNAKHVFRDCLETYGALPWVSPEPIKSMDDADVPPWSLI